MAEKIVLIDGHSILNRTFYGLPDLTDAEGHHTNAVYGFLNILFKILEETKPEYLAVAFDVHAPTFRHKMFADYKGTRKGMPEELREQVPLMKEVLKAMGVCVVTLEGYEADDILGTLAVRSEKEGKEVTILSGDRDLLQLATEHVLVRIPKTKGGQTTIEDYYAEDVRQAYGVTPEQFVDLKGLMGDSSDNIPGVPGIGIKTATKIIAEFGSVENAYANLDAVRPQKAQDSMREHRDLAFLSKELAAINTDSPVVLSTDETKTGDLYTKEAFALFKRLGFKNHLSRFSEEASDTDQRMNVEILTDPVKTEAFLQKAVRSGAAGLFLAAEHDKLALKETIYGLAVSLSYGETAYIPVRGPVTQEYLQAKTAEIAEGAGRVAVYDLKNMLHAAPVKEHEKIFDILIAAYLLDPLASEYPFDKIAAEFVPEVILSANEIFSERKLPSFADMPEDKLAFYAGETAYVAFASMEPMRRKLRSEGMEKLFTDVEMPLVYTLHDMEEAGVLLKTDELAEYGKRLQVRIEEIEKKIYSQAGEEFNIQSPKQLGVILFEKMHLPGGKKTKTGYSTAANVLEKLAPDVPMIADILEYRQLTKLKSTYADGLAQYVSADGRVHTSFQQTITATGRISSTEPNLQNIPVRMELGREIRRAFVPKNGWVFADADYSQIELRVLAHMSGDRKLIEAYRENKDIHTITASQVFHVPFEEVTPLMRRNAKAVNFGIVYGISSFGLSQGLSITRKEAAEYIERYFETYPGIKAFLDGLVASAKETGNSLTMFGRKRPVPELASSNFMQRQFGERVAMNAPIQGTAADIIKIAMNRVNRRLKAENRQARLLMQVHDELLIEAREEEAEEIRQLLAEEMTGAADLSVKLEVDAHTGESWYEAK